jgi:hypothetical protein
LVDGTCGRRYASTMSAIRIRVITASEMISNGSGTMGMH